MTTFQSSYDFINDKIKAMKDTYPSLRNKPNDYVFSALCVKSIFYKNPALILNESDFGDIIVDGQYDGGVDILLSDPNSEGADLVIGQAKLYRSISYEDVLNAMLKMALFYKDMIRGNYEQVNATVQRRFLSLNSEIGDESKICFVFYTSAPQSGIHRDRIEKKFREQFTGVSNIDVSILFGTDIEEEIKESESRRPTVEYGKIRIDTTDNYLLYGDGAAIVNVSAYSIKQLYAQHNTNLLARNLRYHVKGRDIDKAISDTISSDPESFWLKNNGITIICSDFDIDGREVKLYNFSIVNGGQTTYMLHKSTSINSDHDLYLPCKIIRIIGNTEDERNSFSLSIAKATNSQKAIRAVDLKANSPEQVRFAREMRQAGIFYQTKRGESIPAAYRAPYMNTDLVEIGKLCLAAIFQIPCASRSKPSSLYQDKYYETIFNGNQSQIAKLCRELLYIDNYFRTVYQHDFDRENATMPNASMRISFAHNARTICIAFVAFAARYRQGNISEHDLTPIFSNVGSSESTADAMYETFRNLGKLQYFIAPSIFEDKNLYDSVLNKLFTIVINAGITSYSFECKHDTKLTATNYLKKDKNYYDILSSQWSRTRDDIAKVFDDVGM
ncbi:MAG: AIPR family protein [Eubacteriales bacterium]|nr:AIPR family protein [Eubacteriales bacterium]